MCISSFFFLSFSVIADSFFLLPSPCTLASSFFLHKIQAAVTEVLKAAVQVEGAAVVIGRKVNSFF
jgi:hypothetical protein